MNKKTKRGIILTSLVSIAFAGSLLAGSTYALFTSESTTNIAVSSGTVDVVATIDDESLTTYSGENLTGNVETDASNIKETKDFSGGQNGKFITGGTATFNSSGDLVLDKMVPGDKVTFNIKVKNNSNVNIKYRTIISCTEDNGLFNGLEFTIGSNKFDGITTKSDWTSLSANAAFNPNTIACTVELPSDATNIYEGTTCKVSYKVEAVQGNAEVAKFVEVSSEQELREALYNASTTGTVTNIKLNDNVTLNMLYSYGLYNDDTNKLDDNAPGNTLDRYKIVCHSKDEVNADTNKASFGGKYYVEDGKDQIARLVVKENQDVVIDLNGYTIKKDDGVTYVDSKLTHVDLIANYGSLKITNSYNGSSSSFLYGNGGVYSAGAVLHNYSNALLIAENVTVDSNKKENVGVSYGQAGILNEGGVVSLNNVTAKGLNSSQNNASIVKNANGGRLFIKGNSKITSYKALNCESGYVYVESATITGDKYAIKAETGCVVTIKQSGVRVNGKKETEGGTYIYK